jgi:MoxR-like ATPase
LALKYNLGVGILLPERLFPPKFITIASSNYDDTVEYPIDQATLSRLQDPALTTDAFHRLYRELTSSVIHPKGRY